MEKYKVTRVFEFPADWAVPYLMDNDEELEYTIEDLDDVTAWEVVEETDDGKRRKSKKRWCAHSEIPRFAQHIFKPEFLTFFERSVWERGNWTYEFKIEPMADYLKKRLDCKGKTVFRERKGKTERDFELKISLSIPLVGNAIEKFIIGKLAENERKECELTAKSLQIGYDKLKSKQ